MWLRSVCSTFPLYGLIEYSHNQGRRLLHSPSPTALPTVKALLCPVSFIELLLYSNNSISACVCGMLLRTKYLTIRREHDTASQ